MNILYRNIIAMACMVACMLLLPADAAALPLDTYAPQSKLSSGHWVKSKSPIPAYTGLLPTSCANGGFQQPENVRVYGYGGNIQSDILNAVTYTDDLPLAGCEYTSRGLFFYAHGPLSWEQDPSGRYLPVHNYYSTDATTFCRMPRELPEESPPQARP